MVFPPPAPLPGLSVETLVWMDLRLLGRTMRTCPVSEVYRGLAPWMLSGFAVIMLSGVNAGVYHLVTERHIAHWDFAPPPPLVARITGLISVGAWIVTVLASRAMSYTMSYTMF